MTSIEGTIPTEIGRLSNLGRRFLLQVQWLSCRISLILSLFRQNAILLAICSCWTTPSLYTERCRPRLVIVSNLVRFQLKWMNELLYDTISPVLCSESLIMDASRVGGNIPTELGELTSVVDLWMRNSGFTGTIPESFQNLNNLNSLVLHGNSLTGTLPEWLGTLEKLRLLELFWNNFEGSIPESLCRATLRLYYDCHQPCDCCGLCGPVS